MTKAILIDSKNKTITEVEKTEDGIKDIYEHLGDDVRMFTVVNITETACVFVDDEGLLKEPYIDKDGNKHFMDGFKINTYPQVIMGNGLILGFDEMGETIDCPLSLQEVENMVTMVEYDNPEDRPEPRIEVVPF